MYAQTSWAEMWTQNDVRLSWLVYINLYFGKGSSGFLQVGQY